MRYLLIRPSTEHLYIHITFYVAQKSKNEKNAIKIFLVWTSVISIRSQILAFILNIVCWFKIGRLQTAFLKMSCLSLELLHLLLTFLMPAYITFLQSFSVSFFTFKSMQYFVFWSALHFQNHWLKIETEYLLSQKLHQFQF